MSATATPVSPLLESALSVVAKLSREEKALLVERVKAELTEEEVPKWHLEILAERASESVEDALPAESAFRQIREELQRGRNER